MDFVTYHIMESLRASLAEAENTGFPDHQLAAHTRMRFIHMRTHELWQLAAVTSSPPERPVEMVFRELIEEREHLVNTAHNWMKYLEPDAVAEPV